MKKTVWMVYAILMIVSLFFVDRFYGNDLDSDLESMAEVVYAIEGNEDNYGYEVTMVETN